MRVALVSDMFLPRRGGIELHLADLAARLTAAGHTVEVLTPTPGDVAPPGVRVRRLPVPLLPGADIAYTPALRATLDAAIANGRYDVVHCHASVVSPAAWAGAWAARHRGVPTVLTFHSVLHVSAPLLGTARRLLGGGAWPMRVTGVSTLVAAQARPVAPDRVADVLPNGADVAWWARARHARADAERAWRDPWRDAPSARGTRELRLVCAMRLTRKKRPAALIDLVAALRAVAPPDLRVRLALAGEGSERPRLERMIRRAALGDTVRLLGWRERGELRALYGGADCFVLPTRAEAFGIAALEARAAALPILAYAGSGVADFVRDGQHGFLCATDRDMGDALGRVAREPATLAALAARCRAEPPTTYGWDAVIARHVAEYESAIAAAGQRPDVRVATTRQLTVTERA